MHLKAIALALSASAASVLALAQEVNPQPLASDHPLVGTWRIELPSMNCFEEYTLRSNGTKSSVSAQERNESVFELSSEPSAQGFYRWADKITKGNGKPDCSGAITEVGHVAVNFVRLHASGKRFLLCESEALSSCYAEFHRKGNDA